MKAAAISPKIAPEAPTVSCVRVSSSAPKRAGEQRDEVDRREPGRADRRLEQRAEDVEGEHVEGEVDQAGVQEAAGDDPVPLAAGDDRAEERRSRRSASPLAVERGRPPVPIVDEEGDTLSPISA